MWNDNKAKYGAGMRIGKEFRLQVKMWLNEYQRRRIVGYFIEILSDRPQLSRYIFAFLEALAPEDESPKNACQFSMKWMPGFSWNW